MANRLLEFERKIELKHDGVHSVELDLEALCFLVQAGQDDRQLAKYVSVDDRTEEEARRRYHNLSYCPWHIVTTIYGPKANL